MQTMWKGIIFVFLLFENYNSLFSSQVNNTKCISTIILDLLVSKLEELLIYKQFLL